MNELTNMNSEEDLVSNFELGTLEKILLQTKNDDAIADIDNQLKELDSVLNVLKDHTLGLISNVGKVEDSSTRRMNTKEKPRVSQVYITAQTGNLISLINSKASMLKQKNDLRTSSMDRAYKVLSQIAKERSGQGGDSLPLDQILTFLMNAGITVPVSPNHPERTVLDETVNEDDIDAELMGVITEHNIAAIRLNDQGNPISEEEYQRLQAEKLENNVYDGETVITNNDGATLIFYDTEEDKVYLTNADYEVIREISEDELDLVEQEDGTFYCNNFNLPVESNDEDEDDE